MRFIFAFLVLAALQGPALAFNPIKSVVSLPFRAVKLGAKVAMLPVKLAYRTTKTTVKTTAADRAMAFAIKRAPYKDLAVLAL